VKCEVTAAHRAFTVSQYDSAVNFNILWVAALSYLFGAIPFGVLVARTYQIDIQRVGSGNTGASNVMRAAGVGPALVVALADIMKGGIAVLIARALGMPGWEITVVGFSAVIGHNYSVFLGFRGGKGVATSYGTVLLLDVGLGLALLPIMFTNVIITRYMSAGSMLTSFVAIILGIAMKREWWFISMLMLMFSMIIFKHRDNLDRIRFRTEPQIGERVTKGIVGSSSPEPAKTPESPLL
jgi:acyl phosphate:glycerol-3-phosphate acyltransferase